MQDADARFDRFIDRIALTPDELQLARRTAQNIAAILRRVLRPDADEHTDHLVIGGVGKRTAIRPLHAVDLAYLLPDAESVRQAMLLVEDIICQAMPGLTPRQTGPGFTIPLGDWSVFLFIVLERPRGFAFLGEESWIDCHPAAEITALRMSDGLTQGRTTRLLILLKAWAIADQVPLSSFVLEILSREFMTDHGGESWPTILTDFFAWIRHKDTNALLAPGSRKVMTVETDWQKHAEAAYWRCVLAKRLAGEGDELAELAEWRRLLGPAFGHHDE